MASWLRNFKHLNQCDKYLASLAELFTIVSRFVGLVNSVFGTSAVESVNVRTQVFIYPFAIRLTTAVLTACPFLWGSQDIDFAALYKAYNDELMTWKVVIDERHRGEKKSSGLSHLPPSLLSAPHGWPAPRSFFIATDPAIVMEITLVHWCVLSRNMSYNLSYRCIQRGC